MPAINRLSPQGVKALLSVLPGGSGDFEGGSVQATILDSTTSAATDWNTAASLAAFTTLGELSSVSRVNVSGIAINISGTQVQIDFATITFPTLAAGTNNPAHCLVFVSKAGAATDADRVPLAIGEVTEVPDGTDYQVIIPAAGIADIDTA